MVSPSTPKKKFRKHLYDSEHDDNLIDRLSGLTQDLLLRILCLLSLKEALRTCVLSRKWRDLCQFFSGSLNFEASKTLMSDPKKLLKEKDGYVEWITRFLDSHRAGTIDELRVCFDLNQQHRRYINRWIDIAVIKKVKRLELDFEPCRSNLRRDGQNYLFGWKFSSSSEIRFLSSLCLKHIDVSGQILESFLSNCPLLETLHVSHSKQLTHINVCGSSLRLKHLHISFCNCIKSIEVYAPNLVSFEYRGEHYIALRIDLKYVPQLCDVSYAGDWDYLQTHAMGISIPSCLATSQLVNLLLRISYLPLVGISRIQPDFPNLRYFTLEVPNIRLQIEHAGLIVKLCHLLKHMPLLHKFKVELEAVEPCTLIEEKYSSIIKKCHLVRPVQKRRFVMLREVEIVGFVGAASDCIIVCFLAFHAPNLDKIVINCCLPHWHRAAPLDEQKIKEREKGRRIAYDMLSAIRPKYSKFVP